MTDLSNELARELWTKHGGKQHGPHTETLYMPEDNFAAFVAELLERRTSQPVAGSVLMRALVRAEAFASDYEYETDEGFHPTSDLERMLLPVAVKGLEWTRPPYLEDIQRADTIFGIYRVWSHDASLVWFWNFDGYEKVSGEADNEVEALASAQSHFEWIIRSALSPAPSLAVSDEMVEVLREALDFAEDARRWADNSTDLERAIAVCIRLTAALGASHE